MRLAKILVGVVAIFYSSFVVSCAQPPSDGYVAPDIVKAISDWTTCRGTKAGAMIELPRSAESIVDEAFAACIVHERAFKKVWFKHYGPHSAGQVENLRSRWRNSLVASVSSLKANKPVDDPAGAWGICVGVNIPKQIPQDITSEVIVNSALAACSSELETVRADTTRKFGAATATNNLVQLQAEMRKKAIELVENRR